MSYDFQDQLLMDVKRASIENELLMDVKRASIETCKYWTHHTNLIGGCPLLPPIICLLVIYLNLTNLGWESLSVRFFPFRLVTPESPQAPGLRRRLSCVAINGKTEL